MSPSGDSPHALDRRTLLATGATLAVGVTGGCTGCAASPTASLRLVAVDDVALARAALPTYDDGGDGGRAEQDPPSDRDELAMRVVREGSARVEAREPPLPTDRRVIVGEGVYRFAVERIDTREVRAFSVTMNPVRVEEGESTPGPDERIRFDALPAVDRAVFEELGFLEERPIGIGTTIEYRPEAVPDSVLVPEPKYPVVVWPNGPARITVDDSYTYTLFTYEVTATRVDDAAAVGAALRERFGFRFTGLSAAEREILSAAVDPPTPAPEGDDYSGYHVGPDEEPSDAFRSLVDRFRAHERVVVSGEEHDDESGASGEYVVRYDGAVYWADLFVDESVFTGTVTG